MQDDRDSELKAGGGPIEKHGKQGVAYTCVHSCWCTDAPHPHPPPILNAHTQAQANARKLTQTHKQNNTHSVTQATRKATCRLRQTKTRKNYKHTHT